MRNGTVGSEEQLVARLRSGEETAFAELVNTLQGPLIALARTFTRSPALAEDIVQETWIAVIRGLPGFEERSTLRTWVYSILVRRARTLATRESRLARRVESSPFVNGAGHADPLEWEPGTGRQGLWDERPVPWDIQDPEAVLQMRETLAVVERALAELPDAQRQVVLLRDVEDIASTDICNILAISETNQRVLLHRGRARIRRALDRHFRCGEPDARRHRAPREPYAEPSREQSHPREAAP